MTTISYPLAIRPTGFAIDPKGSKCSWKGEIDSIQPGCERPEEYSLLIFSIGLGSVISTEETRVWVGIFWIGEVFPGWIKEFPQRR